jgi:hypothetical protein
MAVLISASIFWRRATKSELKASKRSANTLQKGNQERSCLSNENF